MTHAEKDATVDASTTHVRLDGLALLAMTTLYHLTARRFFPGDDLFFIIMEIHAFVDHALARGVSGERSRSS